MIGQVRTGFSGARAIVHRVSVTGARVSIGRREVSVGVKLWMRSKCCGRYSIKGAKSAVSKMDMVENQW